MMCAAMVDIIKKSCSLFSMITVKQDKYLRTNAYVPEHLVDLMTTVSGGEPFILDNYFCCRKKDWIIVVGYPLEDDFSPDTFEMVVAKVIKQFRPVYVSLIAPELPTSLPGSCREKESDDYYTLKMEDTIIKSGLKRNIKRAQKNLTIEHGNQIPKFMLPHFCFVYWDGMFHN